MIVKIAGGRPDNPPSPDEPVLLLWKAQLGSENDAEVNQIPASVLSEMVPEFEVATWFPLERARDLFLKPAADLENDVWTEVPVQVACASDESYFVSIQVRKHRAARSIVDAVIDLATRLKEGAVWIRVE